VREANFRPDRRLGLHLDSTHAEFYGTFICGAGTNLLGTGTNYVKWTLTGSQMSQNPVRFQVTRATTKSVFSGELFNGAAGVPHGGSPIGACQRKDTPLSGADITRAWPDGGCSLRDTNNYDHNMVAEMSWYTNGYTGNWWVYARSPSPTPPTSTTSGSAPPTRCRATRPTLAMTADNQPMNEPIGHNSAGITELVLPLSAFHLQWRQADQHWRGIRDSDAHDPEMERFTWTPWTDTDTGVSSFFELEAYERETSWWLVYGKLRAEGDAVTVTLADGSRPEVHLLGPLFISEWASTPQQATVARAGLQTMTIDFHRPGVMVSGPRYKRPPPPGSGWVHYG
jgi:hypothetical protein